MSDISDNTIISDSTPYPYNNVEVYEEVNATTNCSKPENIINDDNTTEYIDYSIYNNKDNQKINDIIVKKINNLKNILHVNDVVNKKSDCFWCTCYFDTPSIYIPKYILNGVYHVYGCFCSPECATSYLMKENIDITEKFERYQLLNNIYGIIYNYMTNIKNAPDPYYMLDKYYGNLSIQEYRLLARIDKSYYITDKPFTMVTPEIHEDNGGYISNKIIDSNCSIKNKLNNTKRDIVRNVFGAL
jgi:hypothetical protein